MRTMLIDGNSGMVILEVNIEAIAPQTGDIFVTPQTRYYRIVQRVFVLEEAIQTGLVDLKNKKQVTPVLQLTALPLDEVIEDAISH